MTINSSDSAPGSTPTKQERSPTPTVEKLAILRRIAEDQISASEQEGAFDKPKEQLFLEIGANTGSALSPAELIKIYRKGATVVTVDAPKELGKKRGHTGFGQGGIGAILWGDSVQNSASAYDATRIAECYKLQAQDFPNGAEEYVRDFELDTPESSQYRHVALYTDGRDLPFENETFGTVLMENVLSDPSIPTDTLEDLIAEALRVGDKLTLRNTVTPDIAAERLEFSNLEEAGIQLLYRPVHSKLRQSAYWNHVARDIDLVKADNYGEVPLSIPDHYEIDQIILDQLREKRRLAMAKELAEIRQRRKEKVNSVLAKIGLRRQK